MCGNLCIAIAALLAYLPTPECVNRGRLLAANAAPMPCGYVKPTALNVFVNGQQVIPPGPHGFGYDGIPAGNCNCYYNIGSASNLKFDFWQWWQYQLKRR